MSKKKKEKIDFDEYWLDIKKQAEIETEVQKKEKFRFDAIICPLCKSTKKKKQPKSNLFNEFIICMNCGIHYTDLNKKYLDK